MTVMNPMYFSRWSMSKTDGNLKKKLKLCHI